MDKIAVLIPCYNEEKTIGKVVKDFHKMLPESTIYVYDNNSTDKTSKIAKKEGAIVINEYKQGKGNVIRSMFRDINAECYIMVDGDDTYSAKDARKMCDLILQKKADMVIGNRLSGSYFQENKRLFHNFGNKLVRFIINKLFHTHINDVMTGYRAFNKKFVKGFPVLSKGFEIETEMTIHAIDKNYHCVEIPIDYKDRKEGSVSKLHTYRDGYRVIKTIGILFKEFKPFVFFGFISLIFFILAMIFGISIVIEYYETGLVPRFPTLIVASIFLVISLLLWNTGIILEVIAKKQKETYEIMMNLMNK